ncbi:uncharacterized protein FSUBG_4711 [Fusarium subglutinans]|uniref:Uncharacterized protein n=1 Tax=Gibberella subglutinans TaxID=42677 RepID=A0A8H5V414_GIBSU|nr:uncharacterized protein FSUBG_4711 [Fusarium subglutinans]KAF5608493.1 hypothetical protein FSUBG_4711 [Fusarium subglutinans]
MNLSLLKFDGCNISIPTVFQKSKVEILSIDTTTGHVGVAIKGQALAPVHGGPFPVGVNRIKILNGYLYFTNTAHQSFNRLNIDDMGNKLGNFEVLTKLEKGYPYAPDDVTMDRHGNANEGKTLYVVTSGQNNLAVSGGQVVEVKL